METGFSMEYSKRHHLLVPSSLTLLLPIVLLKMVLIHSKKKFNVILICQMKQPISGHVGERNTTCGVHSHILNNKLEDQDREESKDEIDDEQKT